MGGLTPGSTVAGTTKPTGALLLLTWGTGGGDQTPLPQPLPLHMPLHPQRRLQGRVGAVEMWQQLQQKHQRPSHATSWLSAVCQAQMQMERMGV